MKSIAITKEAAVESRSILVDYITLLKPEITSFSLLTTLTSFYLASSVHFALFLFLATCIGAAFVGCGCAVLNQYLERDLDALMHRTKNRAVPSGRISPLTTLITGIILSLAGVALLAIAVNPLTAFIGAATLITYLFLYTPLKRITPLSIFVGAIPGALPPVLGWTAVRNTFDSGSVMLFAFLFCWQLPHFLALAWMYRKDYERAGYRFYTVLDTDGKRTTRYIFLSSLMLIPVSMALAFIMHLSVLYIIGMSMMGIIFAYSAFKLFLSKSNLSAKTVFHFSLLYLTVWMIMVVVEKMVK